MKRILFILVLFGIVLNTFSQSIGEYDEVIVNDELTVRDSTLIEIIEAQTFGSTIDGANGLNKSGNNIELGGTLDKNTNIEGGLYDLNLGTVASKINTFNVNGQNISIKSDNSILLTASGTSCEWDGTLLVCGSDTIATLADVRSEIAASLPLLPFNFDYTFNASTTDSRPGAGLFRLNNAVMANVTQIYVDYLDNEGLSQSVFLSAPDTGSYITVISDANNYALYQLSGALTDAGNYYKYAVSYKGHNGVISGETTLDFDLSNNVGGTGGGAADSVFQTVTADTVYASNIVFDDGTLINGADTSGKISADTLEANVHIVGQGASKDTLTGAIDLKTAVEAESFDNLTLNGNTVSYNEGTVYYDSSKYNLVYYNDLSAFSGDINRESTVRFINNTASTITDGTIVRAVGTSFINGESIWLADIAGNSSIDSLITIALATVDVAPGEQGEALRIGDANNLNTSAFNTLDLLYVGHAGNLTNSNPEPPLLSSLFGVCKYSDATNGVIYVFPTGETTYRPFPVFSANFYDSAITITNPGVNTYAKITNGTNDLYTETLNYGFTFQGDTVSPMQSGVYLVNFNYSAYATASQTDVYEIGVFKNGVLQYKVDRSFSQNSYGGVPFTIPLSLISTDWVSFRIANTNDATRSSIFSSGAITLEFITTE